MEFAWDGEDAYGRAVEGGFTVRIEYDLSLSITRAIQSHKWTIVCHILAFVTMRATFN